MEIPFVFFWVFLSALVGVLASAYGRSPVAYAAVALLISPVLGLAVVLIAGRTDAARAARIEEEERMRADARARIERERRDGGMRG